MNAGWPYPRRIAHRCGGMLAPENTVAGLRVAVEHGYRGVEFDVMLSGDGTPVLIHDETLERTSNGHGKVAETSDAELARLDAGSWHGARFAGEPIPAFAAAAQTCLALDLWANVEIKPAAGFEVATGTRVAAMAQDIWKGAALPPLLSSFSLAALEAAARHAPALPRGMLYDKVPADWRETLRRLGCISLHCSGHHVDAALLAAVRAAGVALVVYTVNDPQDVAALVRAGVDAVITDRPDLNPAET